MLPTDEKTQQRPLTQITPKTDNANDKASQPTPITSKPIRDNNPTI